MKLAGLKRLCVVAGLVTALSSCGGAGGDDTEAFLQPLKGGIWHGTDAVTGLSVYGIVTESGDFQFLTSDGTQWVAQYAGTSTYDRSTISGSFEAFAFNGAAFADGGVHGMGAFGGLMNPGNRMNLDISILTDGSQTPLEDSLEVTFDESYRRPASIARIAGSFGSGNDTLQVFGNGQVFGVFPASGCTVNGLVEVPDNLHNVYSLTFTLTGCTNAALNGDLTGLATLDDSSVPQRLVGGVTTDGANFAFTLNRL
jgi:hypothetical protein